MSLRCFVLYKAANAHIRPPYLWQSNLGSGAILVAVVLSVIIWGFYLFGHRVSLLFHCFHIFLPFRACSFSPMFYSSQVVFFFVEYCIIFIYGIFSFFPLSPLPGEVGRKRKKKKSKKSNASLRIIHRGMEGEGMEI